MNSKTANIQLLTDLMNNKIKDFIALLPHDRQGDIVVLWRRIREIYINVPAEQRKTLNEWLVGEEFFNVRQQLPRDLAVKLQDLKADFLKVYPLLSPSQKEKLVEIYNIIQNLILLDYPDKLALLDYPGKVSSVFASAEIHGVLEFINSLSLTVSLAWLSVMSLLYIFYSIIKKVLFRLVGALHTILEALYHYFYNGTVELCGRKGARIFGLCLTIFIFLASLNLISLLVMAFTVKSQLSTTFWFSLTIFFSCIILGVKNKGWQYFYMFWNTSVGIVMRLLLLVIEVLSFAIRPLSYALRLFANLLSGHILLHLFSKIILILKKRKKYALAAAPISLLLGFGMLETLVAVLQGLIPPTLLQIWLYECF